jgi:L-amino acid N-acyltransferase YncA
MSPSTVSIHRLGAEDLNVLDRVDDNVFDHPVQRELAACYLRDSNKLLLVAMRDGVVIGMASAIACVHPDKALQLFINEVGVAGRWQGQGIGKKLLQGLLQRGRMMGCIEARATAEEDNLAVRALCDAARGLQQLGHAIVYTWPLSDRSFDDD